MLLLNYQKIIDGAIYLTSVEYDEVDEASCSYPWCFRRRHLPFFSFLAREQNT